MFSIQMIPKNDILGTDGSKICIKPFFYTIKVQLAYSINQVHREQIKTKDLFVCFIEKKFAWIFCAFKKVKWSSNVY